MRRIVLAGALLLAAGCGGGESVSPPPPPPPSNQPGPATSLAIQAGDGQHGVPGSSLAIAPAVLVKDAHGRPVPGVTVSFVVDSGGGQLTSPTAVSDAAGVASSGSWTLGPFEGPNVLSVAVAGVTPVRIRATAEFTAIVLADQSLPAGGGTITYNKAGDPLDGFTLRVPAGAYGSPQQWRVESKPSLKLSLPAGVTQIGGGLVVGNDQDYSDSLIVIRIPVHLTLDSALAAFYYDPATQYLDLAPVVSRDAGSISVAVRHVGSRFLWQPQSAALHSSPANVSTSFGQVTFILVAMPTAQLNSPVTTGFLPGVDDWEFTNWGSQLSPGGICAGMSISALYYFSRIKPASHKGLFHQYDLVPAFDWDNPQGIRFASMIQHLLIAGAWDTMRNRMISLAQQSQLTLAQLSYQSLIIAMRTTSRPQAFSMDDGVLDGHGHEVIAYAAGGGIVKLADPNQPGTAGVTATFSSNHFLPISLQPNAGEGAQLYTRVFVYGSSSEIPTATIDAEWQRFVGGIAGNGTFISLGFESNDDENDPVYQPLGDSVSVWGDYLALGASCPICTIPHFVANLNDRRGAEVASPLRPAASLRDSIGIRLIVNDKFANFKWVLVKARPFKVVPQGQTFVVGRPVSIVARPFGPAPAGTRYVWDFGDGTAPVTLVDDSTVSHVFARLGDVVVKAELRDASGKKLGAAAADLELGGPAWRIDSVGVSQSGPAFVGQADADTVYHDAVVAALNALQASPGDNLIIAREQTGVWQQVAAGQGSTVKGFVEDTALCGLGQEGTGVLSLPCHFFIAALPNYTLGAIGSGTLTGKYSITEPSEPFYAGFLNTITASMTPGFLRGQMTIASFGGGTGPVFTVKFRAVEVVVP